MGDDDDSLRDYVGKPMESDIESARKRPVINPERAVRSEGTYRKASEDKSPMQGDDIWDMELPYWEGFDMTPWNFPDIPAFANPPELPGYGYYPGIRNFRYPEQPVPEDTAPIPGMYYVGCSLSCPLFVQGNTTLGIKCTDKFTCSVPTYFGIVTGVKKQGPAYVNLVSNGPYYTIIITPYKNIKSGAIVKVTLMTLSVYNKVKKVGSCSATIEFTDCEEECECVGAIPTVYATGDEVAAGGTQTLWVNSGGTACPTYSWAVDKAGYSISPTTTENDFDMVTLSADAAGCGGGFDPYVTVTATDACGVSSSYLIRRTGTGEAWGALVDLCGSFCASKVCYGAPIGIERYVFSWGTSTPYKYDADCQVYLTVGGILNLPVIAWYDSECGSLRPRMRVDAPPGYFTSTGACTGAPCSITAQVCAVSRQVWSCP